MEVSATSASMKMAGSPVALLGLALYIHSWRCPCSVATPGMGFCGCQRYSSGMDSSENASWSSLAKASLTKLVWPRRSLEGLHLLRQEFGRGRLKRHGVRTR